MLVWTGERWDLHATPDLFFQQNSYINIWKNIQNIFPKCSIDGAITVMSSSLAIMEKYCGLEYLTLIRTRWILVLDRISYPISFVSIEITNSVLHLTHFCDQIGLFTIVCLWIPETIYSSRSRYTPTSV